MTGHNRNGPRRRQSLRSGAFTLLELLVVIGLVALLAALLSPALQSAVASNRQVKCATNLYQLSGAINLYVADKGFYPYTQYLQNPTGENAWSRSATLGKYLGGKQGDNIEGCKLFLCPEHRDPNLEPPTGNRSYGANKFVMLLQWMDESKSQVPPAAVPRPSEVILLGDGLANQQGTVALSILRPAAFYSNPSNAENVVRPLPSRKLEDGATVDAQTDVYLSYRHRGKANVVFCDGHVEALEIGKVKEKNFSIDY